MSTDTCGTSGSLHIRNKHCLQNHAIAGLPHATFSSPQHRRWNTELSLCWLNFKDGSGMGLVSQGLVTRGKASQGYGYPYQTISRISALFLLRYLTWRFQAEPVWFLHWRGRWLLRGWCQPRQVNVCPVALTRHVVERSVRHLTIHSGLATFGDSMVITLCHYALPSALSLWTGTGRDEFSWISMLAG